MTNKMKLLVGLLVLGVVLLGGGLAFLLFFSQPKGMEIALSPAPGSYLLNSENQSSGVLLEDVQIAEGVSDKHYISMWPTTISAGDSILIVSGSIQNNHQENEEITMYAAGYDKTGKQVIWTYYDASRPVVQREPYLDLETGETGEFTLHLNFDKDVKSITIFANNYAVPPP